VGQTRKKINERTLDVPQGHSLPVGWCLYSQALKSSSEDYKIHILTIQIELFMYEFFSFHFLTTEAMLPLLPCTARHWCISWMQSHPQHSNPEDRSTVFLRNVGIDLQDCMVSQPRKPQSDPSLL
jgi:hypothetical protein